MPVMSETSTHSNTMPFRSQLENYLPASLIYLICYIGHYIYLGWFWINRSLVNIIKKYISPIGALFFGMIVLEGHTLCRAAWCTKRKYRQNPKVYGLEEFNSENKRHRPVLLLHGAAGSWSYLGDLALTLRSANIPVFVIDLGFGSATDETRRAVLDKIHTIRRLYVDTFAKQNNNDSQSHTMLSTTTQTIEAPLVDIVAHSNGGNLGLYSAFTPACSFINQNAQLEFRNVPEANSDVGKIITIALPSNAEEVDWMRQVNKVSDLFNINAKYDALMGHKKCALINELSAQSTSIDAAHIGIVFEDATAQRLIEYLSK